MTRLDLTPQPEWMTHASCRGTDPDQFFPEPGQSNKLNAARAICRTCPVISECLEYALDWRFEDGVWGGLSGRERIKLRRTHNRRVVCAQCGHSFVTSSSSRRLCSEECAATRRVENRHEYHERTGT